MLLLAVPAVVLPAGLTQRRNPFRRHVSRFAAKPATTCHRQPPRARLPARLHPTVRPAESQPRTTPHWHVAVPSVAPARVAALAVGPRRFCAPLAAVSQPQLRLRSEPHNQKFQRSPPWPYRTTLKLWLWGSERQAR